MLELAVLLHLYKQSFQSGNYTCVNPPILMLCNIRPVIYHTLSNQMWNLADVVQVL